MLSLPGASALAFGQARSTVTRRDRGRARPARRLLAAALAATLALAAPAPAAGQGLIRDAGGEYALRQIAGPVLSAAGLSSGRVRVLMIGDNSMNAFVADARTILVHTGLILRLDSADELLAVIAHEAAHIANGHLARRLTNARGAAQGAFAGLLLGLAAGVAGAGGEAAAGIAAGTAGSAQRLFLSHTRAEEAAADQSGVRYMAAAGADPAATLDVLDLFRGQELLGPERQDPYARTHPLSRDRLRALRGYVAAQGPPAPSAGRDSAEYWFGRVQATVAGFMQNPATTLRRYPASDTSDAGRIAR
ncbi:MAG: M48 family metalloprotease, partial [Rhodobacteraceae bacterium]|nr:M48 family metalloprotease [Paracoccaceae bacterium]